MPISLRASTALITALALAHVLAAAAVLACGLPWIACAAWLTGVAASAALSLRRAALRAGDAVRALVTAEDGTLSLQDARGNWTAYTVLGGTRVTAWAVALDLEAAPTLDRAAVAARRRSLLVMFDAISAEDFRRLRVWLLWVAARIRDPLQPRAEFFCGAGGAGGASRRRYNNYL